jgi:hypothetical protein
MRAKIFIQFSKSWMVMSLRMARFVYKNPSRLAMASVRAIAKKGHQEPPASGYEGNITHIPILFKPKLWILLYIFCE